MDIQMARSQAQRCGREAQTYLRFSAGAQNDEDRDIADQNVYILAVRAAHAALDYLDPEGNADRPRLGNESLGEVRGLNDIPVLIVRTP